MEQYNKNQDTKEKDKRENPIVENSRSGRVWIGLVIIIIGTIAIAREAGVDIPRWVTQWPMILIAVGIFIGARSNFRHWHWLIPVGVGIAFTIDRIYWDINIGPYVWPVAIIVVGLFIIFRPKRRDSGPWIDWKKAQMESQATPLTGDEDILEMVAVFGSNKRIVLSKNFRGGEAVSFFGGTELNLAQADIQGPVALELVQVFGGSKLIVPANWRIQSELVSVFGGVDDKRLIQPNTDPNKVLILRGTNVFGGLEIKSY